ncbi:1-acyl-sn-glycerol-3-phosphate acyltransferase [Shimazuella sp. AN120528]|uniref:lysophospholipid acyltransferase family protein n=1 Tax=Shimazuella soli TaxID=1892854 RepID=UPI001F0E5FDA|nr:lysophospholipid acyltransferase family protein [Shimazuella soli]MCH5584316.1 1-acyl-sn-glycerol-3-phosphate acyltransferase [Shimazuella soli]
MSESRGWYVFFRKCFRILFVTIFRWKVVGLEHVPTEGPAVICSNHISLLDPPLVGSASKRPIHFMAKEELFHIPVLSYFLPKILAFPVKRGQSDMKAVKTAIKILKSNELFGIFPEGTRKKSNGSEQEAEEGAVFIALKAKAPIIPVALIGPYRLFRSVRVIFGEPIDTTPYSTGKISKEVVSEVTRIMMDNIQTIIQQNR